MKHTPYDIALIILIAGGLILGIFGLLSFNIIAGIFGTGFFARLLYIIFGAAAAYVLVKTFIYKDLP